MPPGAPTSLRCEYLVDPIGIDETHPRLFWQLDDERPGARQSAWQVLAASDPARLERDEGDLWDSGRVESRETAQVPWAGAPLRSRARVWWKVRSFDDRGEPSPWSAAVRFELGLLERTDWSAQWIGAPGMGGPRTSAPVPALRRGFELRAPALHARLYATALGLYELELNGRRVGDQELAPGWTDYRRRVRYQVYDVAPLLVAGENVLGALLGDGWYCGFIALGDRQQYGERPLLFAQLEARLADGTRTTLASDGDWSWHPSPLLESDLMQGESYDARQELGGWTLPGADQNGWQPVEVARDPGVALVATASPPVRKLQEVRPLGEPVRRRRLPGPRRWIFDLGQNLVGRVRLRVRGPRGAWLRLRHAEMLDADGELYTANLGEARATDHYTLRGGGEAEVFEPRFTFHGFRYVEVAGTIPEQGLEELVGVVLGSDLRETGTFSSSSPLLERLQSNIVWGQQGNFLDVPTDCPQRNERLGWTGDAQVFARSAAFNRDVAAFLAKWLVDLADGQHADGAVPPVAPATRLGTTELRDGGPAWADAIVIVPWTLYRCYGDLRILERHWDGMQAFLENLRRRFPDGVRADPAREPFAVVFGDWLAPDARGPGDTRVGATPRDLIGTAFYGHSARLLSRIAGALGRRADELRLAELAARVREAFRRRFVTPDGRVAGETQTGYVLALHFELLEKEERARAAEALVRDIRARGDHLATGFVGTPYLLHALTGAGRLDVAYALLHQTTCPSWLFPVLQGATTIWERWDGWTPERGFQDPSMNSFNHYAFGSVGEWLYGTVAGLELDPDPDPGRNAWRRALLHPHPPLGPGFAGPPSLTHAAARLESVHGRFESAWRIEDGRFAYVVRVPPNCEASVVLPDGARHEVEAGRHRFELGLPAPGADGAGG